jgi:Tfp pilus assembly ATPase PilU
VVSQRLLPRIGGGRVAAIEAMVMNARIAELIREARADEITDAVAEGEYFGMQTFTQALIEHVLAGSIDREVAANAATHRHDFLVALERAEKVRRAADAADEPAPVPSAEAQVEQHQPEQLETGLRIVPAG